MATVTSAGDCHKATDYSPAHHLKGLPEQGGRRMDSGASNTTEEGGESIPSSFTMRSHIVESDYIVPKKVVRQETYETITRVPERRLVEDIVEDTVRVREKIIEVEKPIVQETLVEVPEVQYVETTLSFDATRHEERIKNVPKVRIEEEIVQVPKILTVEKIVEVPQIEHQEILVEKIVEVPEYQDEVVVKEVPMDEYVEVPIFQDKLIKTERTYERKLPVPVELVSEWKFRMPNLKSAPRVQKIPIYVPRFIEVPMPSAYLTDEEFAQARDMYTMLQTMAKNPAPSLAELERLGAMVRAQGHLIRQENSAETDAAISSKLRSQLQYNNSNPYDLNSALMGGNKTVVPTATTLI